MTDVFVRLLLYITLAMADGREAMCDLGVSVRDFYPEAAEPWHEWADDHPDATVRLEVYSPGEGVDFWLYEDEDTYLLFIFQENGDDLLSGVEHGSCARVLTTE